LYYDITKSNDMGSFENHLKLYEAFKKDAENSSLSIPSKAELYFLSIFHLIESYASKLNYHINKHQRVRQVLEVSKIIEYNSKKNRKGTI